MADNISNYLEGKLIEHVLRNVAYASPSTVYVGLFTSSPTESGTGGSEVSGGAYARKSVTFGAHSNGLCANSSAITFTTATASWGTVSYFAIFDALTGGNMLFYGPLTTPKTISQGDTARFPAGALSVQLS